MSLAAFQEALARRVMGSPGRLGAADRGLAVTAAIRRSWCEARTAKAGRLTLSALPTPLRRELVRRWVDGGGGAGAFHALEAQAFLAFVEAHLPEPSHERTLCRLEAALARASCAVDFRPPRRTALRPGQVLARAGAASLIPFTADPVALLQALTGGGPAPALSKSPYPMLVAPGIEAHARPATLGEAALWTRLETPAPWSKDDEADLPRLLDEGVLALA